METPFFVYYTIKSSILLGNRLVIVTEDGIFTSALVEVTTLPNIAKTGNVQQSKILS